MQLDPIPDEILKRGDDISPQTRWPARIPTEGRTVEEVLLDLNRRLRALPEEDALHYYDFANMAKYDRRQGPYTPRWPYGCWTACFPAKGSNEGYYVHISAILRDGTHQTLGLCKCETEQLAMRIANVAFLLLEA